LDGFLNPSWVFSKVWLAKWACILEFIGSFINMTFVNVRPFLAMGQPPSPPGTQPDPRAQMLNTIGLLVVMVVMFYFILIRPQQKKAKEHAQLLKSVKPGDRIVTTGGVVAVVVTVKEKTLTVRSADAKFEITKSAIAEITERSGESSES
jgi:preprotein translocase subunit YajC